MATSREYAASITVSFAQLEQMRDAQNYSYIHGHWGDGSANTVALTGALTGYSATILGLLFVTSTPAGIAVGVTSLVASLFATIGNDVGHVIQNGVSSMTEMIRVLRPLTRYDLFQIRFPFLEFSLQDGTVIRFISGNGVIERAHSGSGWEIV